MPTGKEREILAVLEDVRPMLRLHAGGVEFVGFNAATGVVSVRLQGTCRGCVLADLTLKSGIEALMKERVEGVTSVEAVQEEAAV